MGTINQSTKPNGSTNWVDGDSVTGTGLSADMNTIYSEFNGNIENVNIKAAAGIVGSKLAVGTLTDTQINAAADIDPGKINDFSASAAEHNTMVSPGNSAASVNAVTLEGELSQLRYALRTHGIGASAKITDGSTSGLKANGEAAWSDPPVIGPGLMRNASFLDATAASAGVPPVNWSTVGAPSTLARVALDVIEGRGEAIRIIDNGAGALDGISQTLNLRASSQYLVIARVKPVTTTCKLVTTGATGTFGNLAIVSASGGSVWQTLAGVISTDATPTSIVVSVTAAVASSEFQVSYVDVFPLGTDKFERARPFRRTRTSTAVVNATLQSETTISVIAQPGHAITVSGYLGIVIANVATNSVTGSMEARIEEDVDGGGFNTISNPSASFAFSTGSAFTMTDTRIIPVEFVRDNPGPGSVYSYRLSAVGAGVAALNPSQHRLTVSMDRV